jgi:DNA (cytosine-5)-methyltransferase 1
VGARPKLLDLFCGAGGAAAGYVRAGFDVVGVDINPQPRYPFEFIQADAMTYPLDGFDAIHASPPCQAFSAASNFGKVRERHADLLTPMRTRLIEWCGLPSWDKPWVIENVIGAPLRGVTLCGSMFSLGVLRHRRFESNLMILQPEHQKHVGGTTPLRHRRAHRAGEYLTVTSHFAQPLAQVQMAMDIDWMNHAEIAQAIPPAYTEFIGAQLIRAVTQPSAERQSA